jgi:hypothetical protein
MFIPLLAIVSALYLRGTVVGSMLLFGSDFFTEDDATRLHDLNQWQTASYAIVILFAIVLLASLRK